MTATLRLPNTLSPKAVEALEDLVRCCEEGFTGCLAYEFTEGVPVLRKRTDTKRYRKPVVDSG